MPKTKIKPGSNNKRISKALAKNNSARKVSKPKNPIDTDSSYFQQNALDLLHQGTPIKTLFCFLAEQMESYMPGTAILLSYFDSQAVRQVTAPSLPPRFLKEITNLKQSVFKNAFSCENGQGKNLSSADIKQSPEWKTINVESLAPTYRYCFTTLIFNSRGTCLGTISLFAPTKKKPTKAQSSFIQTAGQIACLAIEDQKKVREIRKLKTKASNEVEDRTQKIREAIRQLQDEIVQRKIMERSLKTSNEKLQNLSNHLENVREEERTRISREIHDELGQMLTTLKMKLAILEERTLDEGFPIQEDIQIMMKLVETTLETVRRISTELRPGILDVLGLSEALEWQAQEFQEQTKIKIHSEIQRLPENLGKELSTTCFRICQEALTNVARHAKAKRVTVSLKHEQGKLELIVRDNGKGITNEQLSRITSLGLIGMRERAQNLGGDLNIQRATPNGTEVSFSFPLELA